MRILYFLSSAILMVMIHTQCGKTKPNDVNKGTMQSYDDLWKKIEKLDQDGLPKSALLVADSIHQLAKRENNTVQQIKSIIYIAKYSGQLDEQGLITSIHQLNNELNTVTDPVLQSIYHSYLAQLYHSYFQMNAWKIRSRTSVQGSTSEDVSVWSAVDFLQKIRFHYLASVQKPPLTLLPIQAYSNLLTEGKLTDTLRPYLFDILAHRVIDYFLSSESNLDESDADRILDAPILFGHTDRFLEFKPSDTSSSSSILIGLFQELEALHKNKGNQQAWMDVVHKRLRYVYDQFTGADKQSLYEAALNQWINSLSDKKSLVPFILRKAQLYQELGSQYQIPSIDTVYKDYLAKSVNLYQQILRDHGGSEEAKQAKNNLIAIKIPQINAEAEQVNSPGKPFRIFVQYKNIDRIYIKVIPVSTALKQELYGQPWELTIEKILNQSAVQSFDQSLPGSSDYHQHSAELKIDALPYGMYAILLSSDQTFNHKDHASALVYTHVSNLAHLHSFFHYGHPINSNELPTQNMVVVDRTTGAPLTGIVCTFYENIYNPGRQKSEWKKVLTSPTDKDGKVNPDLPKNKNYSVQLEKTGPQPDQLWLDASFSQYSYNQGYPQDQTEVLYFLDRSIYRPGQTVYFKALVIHRLPNGKPEILKNKIIEVHLFDANGQMVMNKSYTTNDWGTINGTFVTPSSGLLGSMYLQSNISQGTAPFQVEEYKRPKFEILFDTNKIITVLNGATQVTGQAKNFAGNAVDQAIVKYRVTRQRWMRPMPWWWGWRSYIPDAGQAQIIAQGTTQTDAQGKFSIPYVAQVPPTTNLKDDVSFTFSVEVDITDFTGETRSNTTSSRIGTRNLVISSSLQQNHDKEQLKTVTLHITDLNGTPLPLPGKAIVSKIKQPSTVWRNRYWQRPDQFVISAADYKKWFPSDVYMDEDQVSTWPVEKTVWSKDFQSDDPIAILPVLEPGIYKIEATAQDLSKQTSSYQHFFWVHDAAAKVYPSSLPLVSFQDKNILTPGQPVNFGFRTLGIPQYVLQTSSRSSASTWVLSQGIHMDKLSLSESDRGEMHQTVWYMVRDNRVYSGSVHYGLDWSSKDLTIQTMTFRDKLIPGQQEEWKLKITGADKEKWLAEVVASMYDKSLDELYPHDWYRNLYNIQNHAAIQYTAIGFQSMGSEYSYSPWKNGAELESKIYRDLNWFGFDISGHLFLNGVRAGVKRKSTRDARMEEADVAVPMTAEPPPPPAPQATGALTDTYADGAVLSGGATKQKEPGVQVRKNLNETVFFYPDIKTDAEGNFILKFKMNEALTKWRLMVFGHTQDLKNGYLEKEIVTQKDLMVFINAPRFVRQRDKLELPAKVINLTSHVINGNATLELFDPLTNKSLDKDFGLITGTVPFVTPANQSSPLHWEILVPENFTGLLGYRVIAHAGAHSDGEESVMPVLTNRMLITETMPFTVKAKQTKSFVFESMKSKMNAPSIKQHAFVIENTSNPVWYAIQSLPYLMEFPHECTEQLVNRYFANALAAKILEDNPAIKTVFDRWLKMDQLKSPLQKNQDLKTAVLEETPWVKEALREGEQQKMIALLFDLNRMAQEKDKMVQQLTQRQLPNGGFPWFEGRDDWYITQYVIEDLGHLKKLGVLGNELNEVLDKAVKYCDRELIKYYHEIKKVAKDGQPVLSDIAIHYLYARSFFKDLVIEDRMAMDHYLSRIEKDWLKQNIYSQGMVALALHRWKPADTTIKKILQSLTERAQHHSELGMYWKFESGYNYFELPIETQAILIEAFADITQDKNGVDEMRLWLLKNKQTNRWNSTKSTAAAIYALMVHGSTDWIQDSKWSVVKLGEETVHPEPDQVIPGLGYFKVQINKEQISPKLTSIQVTNPNNHIVWGAAYWQYFEDLDKITSFKTMPIQIQKELFIEAAEGNKKTLKPFTYLQVGDKIIVKIILKADRPMDYLHLKDMRASGLEPMHVLSQYKYQDGMGYYESTKDLATHFFIDHLPAGTFVLEYPLRVAQKGIFSNGIPSIQCMYAPEFTAHGPGVQLTVK